MTTFQAFDPDTFQASPAFQTPGKPWVPNEGRVRIIMGTDQRIRARVTPGSEPRVIPQADGSIRIHRTEE